MQGGTFELYLDGDLFKVKITFDVVKNVVEKYSIKAEVTYSMMKAKPFY